MEENVKKTLFHEKVRLATNPVARFLAETRGFRPRSNAQVVARRATEFFHAKRAETTTGRSVYDSRGSPWTKNMPSTKLILTLNMFRHKNWKKGFSVYHSKLDRWWNCRGTRGSYGWQIETPSDQ